MATSTLYDSDLPDIPATFFATLGLQPQIITRALDRLLEQDTAVLQATLIYTAAYRPHPQWPTLRHFQDYLTQKYDTLTWEWIPLQLTPETPILRDVQTPAEAEIAFRVIYRQLRALKQDGWRLQTLIAGGRKSMIVYAMVSAQLLFDPEDHLWHLFSHEEDTTPHVPPTASKLVEIPIFHLGGLMPMVRQLLLNAEDPTLAINLYQEHENVEKVLRLRQFWQECEPLDQQLIQLAFIGYSNSQIGEQVGLSDSAVNNRLSAVADRFFRSPAYGKRLTNRPKHIRPLLLHHLRPLLLKLSPPI